MIRRFIQMAWFAQTKWEMGLWPKDSPISFISGQTVINYLKFHKIYFKWAWNRSVFSASQADENTCPVFMCMIAQISSRRIRCSAVQVGVRARAKAVKTPAISLNFNTCWQAYFNNRTAGAWRWTRMISIRLRPGTKIQIWFHPSDLIIEVGLYRVSCPSRYTTNHARSAIPYIIWGSEYR